MTHSILTIPVRAGEEAAFLAAFVRLDVFGHAARIPGFGGGELLRPVEAGHAFVVHARWETPEGYQAWLDAPVRAQLSSDLEPYVDGVMSGRLYTSVAE
jgi:heme-degrading monooxygenase HmoA